MIQKTLSSLRIFAPAGCLFLLSLSPGRAALMAYEGFNYPDGGSLGALNGGTGWNGGWVNVSGGGSVYAGNLAAGGNAPDGYDSRSTGNSAFANNDNRSGRLLDCSPSGSFGSHGYIDANGRIGSDGKTLFISFLQQPSDTVKFYEFEFHQGDLGDPGRIAGIGNDFNSTSVNFRAPNTTQTPIGPGSSNVNFYVVRIDFKPGNDDVSIYRNPAGDTEADNEPVLTMPGAADMSFDGLSLAAFDNGVTVKHDEIRLGETWGDVLGGPPAFVAQPANQNAYAGQNAAFSSLAQSRQAINYQWYCGRGALAEQTNATLTISQLQFSDADNYWIVASNSLGAATSAVVALNVQLIGVSMPAQSLTAGNGSNLVIAPSIEGAQPISMQWFKDGIGLPGETNSTLALPHSDYFDSGKYVLVARNAYGSVTGAVFTVFANLARFWPTKALIMPQKPIFRAKMAVLDGPEPG